jgi:hypothetical protein
MRYREVAASRSPENGLDSPARRANFGGMLWRYRRPSARASPPSHRRMGDESHRLTRSRQVDRLAKTRLIETFLELLQDLKAHFVQWPGATRFDLELVI